MPENEKDPIAQFLADGLEEVSPPGGFVHRQGQQLPRQRLVVDDATRTAFKTWLIDHGATDIRIGADEKTLWWMDPENGGRAADLGFTPATPAGRWEPLEPPALSGRQVEEAAHRRQLDQAMADLLEYSKSIDVRTSGGYAPDRFAQEIIGLGKVVDIRLADWLNTRMDAPVNALDAAAAMLIYQGRMEECAELARDAEALFYDIQAHTAQIEWDATERLMSLTKAGAKGMSETAAKKAIDTQDEQCRRHVVLVRMAGRVKARALDLYAISRRRLRTAQKCVDTYTGKSDDE